MRTIKLRAWNKRTKTMIYGPMAICSGDGGWVMFTSEIEGMDCNKAIHGLPEYEIMQFTGVKDITKRDIYEGDIVKFEGDARLWQVIWDHPTRSWRADWKERDRHLCEMLPERTLIEGNIYENPDLLATGGQA